MYLKYICLINMYLVFGHFWLVFILIILMHVIIHLLNAFNCLHAHIAFFVLVFAVTFTEILHRIV